MKQIAQFFTFYWMIYFPTCIAFNDVGPLSSVDEVMTGILIIYTFMHYGKKRITNTQPWKEYITFFYILIFYIIYSLLFGANGSGAVWYDLMQQIRPWSIIYCTWILNPQFTNKQKKIMAYSMVATLFAFMVYHPQTAANAAGVGSDYRSAPFGQLAICTSMAWYLFIGDSKKNRIIVVAIAVIGLLAMKFKYYGQFGAWMVMLYLIKGKLDFKGGKLVSSIVGVAIIIFVTMMLGWERFNAYYIEGANAVDRQARPEMNKVILPMLLDYFPFGAGLGSFATAASAVYYSPLWAKYNLSGVWGLSQFGEYGHCLIGFHCDSFFATFCQIGFVGIFLFLAFWKRRFKQFNEIQSMQYYKVAMMTFFCIVIEWFGDSSFLSGKGMGYMMLLGLCLNANRNMQRGNR